MAKITNNEDKKVEILAESGSVSKYDYLHYHDAIVFMKDRIIRELMHRFYHNYLQSGKEYKCKFKMERTYEEESGIIKTIGYLYVKECEEDGKGEEE